MEKGGKMKKTWQKPELVVLVRNKPEEVVLQDCKYNFLTGPDNEDNMCGYAPVGECVGPCLYHVQS
jgi:hypothetical protein